MGSPDNPHYRRFTIYRDPHDWWIGYYRGDSNHYVCLIPSVVIRWARRHPEIVP